VFDFAETKIQHISAGDDVMTEGRNLVKALKINRFSHHCSVNMKPKIPFEFVLEELDRVHPRVRPMFGCHAVYTGEKLVMVLRNRDDHADDNGVWLATEREHHPSLRKEFPCLRSIRLLGSAETVWQNIPLDAGGFEELVLRACKLILRGDPRIGSVPKLKKRRH
jgi:hypothetical protein